MRTTLLKKGLRELWQHKMQYSLLVVILSLGVGMYNSMYDFMDSRVATVDALYEESHFMDLQVTFQYGLTLPKNQVEDLLIRSRFAADIVDCEYRLKLDGYLNFTSDETYILKKGIIFGYNYFEESGRIRDITVNTPLFYHEYPTLFRSPTENACFLEKGFADSQGIIPGDVITFQIGQSETDLTILELINMPDYFSVITEGSLFPNPAALGVVVVPMETAQQIAQYPASLSPRINDIVILLRSEANIKDVKQRTQEAFEEAMIPVTIIEKEDNPARASIVGDMEGDQELIGIFPITIFIISGIGLILALRRMVRSQRTQIGIFKALGVDNTIILWYFAIIGFIISFLSIGIGYLISLPLNAMLYQLLQYMFDFAIFKYSFSGQYYILSGILAILLCLSCTLFPAYLAVNVKPIDAIQKREGIGTLASKKRVSKGNITADLPTPFRIVFRDMSRKPMRQFTTVLGVALALTLFLSFVVIFDSFFVFLDASKGVNQWDYEVSMNQFTDMTTAWKWTESESTIELVNPGVMLPMTFNSSEKELDTLLYSFSDLSVSLNLEFSDGIGDGIFISEYIANKFDLQPGDIVDVDLPRLEDNSLFSMKTVQLRIVGIHSNPIGLYVYADLSFVQRMTNLEDQANIFYLHSFHMELPQVIKNRIASIEGVTSLTYEEERESSLDDMFELLVGMIVLLMLVSSTLAAAIVYNLFIINATEKKREYATMKTLGTSQRKIGYLIFIEATVTLLGGILFGSLGGYLLGFYMVSSTEVIEEFSFNIVFSWNGLLLGSFMLTAVVIIVSLLTLRYINKIVVADVIRDRSS